MTEIWRLGIGILFLILAFPIGSFLARITKDEIKDGQRWFKLIIYLGITGSVISIIIQDDILFFSFLFILVITSRSIKQNQNK